MSAHDLRLTIFDQLRQTDDPEILALVHALLAKFLRADAAEVVGFEADGSPISEADFVESIVQSSREARAGQIVSHHDLKARFGIHE